MEAGWRRGWGMRMFRRGCAEGAAGGGRRVEWGMLRRPHARPSAPAPGVAAAEAAAAEDGGITIRTATVLETGRIGSRLTTTAALMPRRRKMTTGTHLRIPPSRRRSGAFARGSATNATSTATYQPASRQLAKTTTNLAAARRRPCERQQDTQHRAQRGGGQETRKREKRAVLR